MIFCSLICHSFFFLNEICILYFRCFFCALLNHIFYLVDIRCFHLSECYDILIMLRRYVKSCLVSLVLSFSRLFFSMFVSKKKKYHDANDCTTIALRHHSNCFFVCVLIMHLCIVMLSCAVGAVDIFSGDNVLYMYKLRLLFSLLR